MLSVVLALLMLVLVMMMVPVMVMVMVMDGEEGGEGCGGVMWDDGGDGDGVEGKW